VQACQTKIAQIHTAKTGEKTKYAIDRCTSGIPGKIYKRNDLTQEPRSQSGKVIHRLILGTRSVI
ncbi:hypothetical protein P3392_23765, partial [Vibrio parahaemolyticus]|nr:hypothetical protein [Vibrio parahaemolyticus]